MNIFRLDNTQKPPQLLLLCNVNINNGSHLLSTQLRTTIKPAFLLYYHYKITTENDVIRLLLSSEQSEKSTSQANRIS